LADLHWLPYDVEQWEERTRELSLEEEGALMRLLRRAWRDTTPCTIADSETVFDRLLGSRWKKLLPLIRQHFTPAADAPGRLRCVWLFALYEHQLRKHESYQSRGKLGGRPRTRPTDERSRAQSSCNSSGFGDSATVESSAKVQPKAQSRENTAERRTSGSLRTHRGSSQPAGALARKDARAAGERTAGPRADAIEAPDERVVSATELAAAEAWIEDRPDVAAAIDEELRASASVIGRPSIEDGREFVHAGRLRAVTTRMLRTGLVVSAYRQAASREATPREPSAKPAAGASA
jgi:uncharacterized protein YdaU (DUF1376 family)